MSGFLHGKGQRDVCLACGRAFVAGEVTIPVVVTGADTGNIHPACIGSITERPAGQFTGIRKETK